MSLPRKSGLMQCREGEELLEWLLIVILLLSLLWVVKRLWIYKLSTICLTYIIHEKLEKKPNEEELKTLFSLALDKYIESMKKGRRYF